MPREMDRTDVGDIICPWCENKIIEKCPHNPFKLMKRIKELEAERREEDDGQQVIEKLREILAIIK